MQREVRLAQRGEVARQKEIWKRCFGDDDRYIDFFYDHRYLEDQTVLLLQDGVISTMLTMIPVNIVTPDEKSFASTMLYAIATYPTMQNQGLATQMMDFTHTYLQAKKNVFSLLVPAERTLVDFYRKLGYEDGFYLRETVWLREKITSLGSEGVCSCSISPIMPAEYNRRRNEWLRGRLYVAYADAEITYQKKLSQLSGADIYGIDAGTVRGCMTVERINSDRLLIKELLVSEKYFTEAIKQMSQQFQAQEYVIRTPAFLVQPGGTIRPFAMLRIHGERKLTVAPAELGYLAFAFD